MLAKKERVAVSGDRSFFFSNFMYGFSMNETSLYLTLAPKTLELVPTVNVFTEIDSTNEESLRRIKRGERGGFLIASSAQSAGRGRRGRTWLSSANAGLYMSLALPFPAAITNLQALSLVTALSVHEALKSLYSLELQLKWPNDLLAENKKLAGILLERQQVEEGAIIVFGIGVNVDIPDSDKAQIDRPVTDLSSLGDSKPELDVLCGAIVNTLVEHVRVFCKEGFGPFQERWNELDYYKGCDIAIEDGNGRTVGKSLGVDANGCLKLQSAEGETTIGSGEIIPSLTPLSDSDR
jgi:BirA family biotin operon repressor/biotin-[acetyl-CoA-carboxylase] ligase